MTREATATAYDRVRDLPASSMARSVGDWLIAEMPTSVRALRVYPAERSGLSFEFENGAWDLTVEIARDGMMLLYGVEIDGPREIEPFPFDAHSGDMVARISRLYVANDR